MPDQSSAKNRADENYDVPGHTEVPQHSGPEAHDEHGHGGSGKYVAVFGGLLALTAASVVVGSFGWFPPVTAGALMMAISCGKALLVMLFFMHLVWEANWKYVLTIPAAMMSIFLVLMLVPDIGMRTRHYNFWRSIDAPQPIEQFRGEIDHEGEADDHDDHGH